MGDIKYMKSQIIEKVKSGFSCIKIKVGALKFESRYLNENLSKSNSKIVYTLSSSKRDFESIFKNVSVKVGFEARKLLDAVKCNPLA